MTYLQRKIRAELEVAEDGVDNYGRLLKVVYDQTFSLMAYHHYMARRRFFLKDLLKVQLKEFDRG